MLWECHYLLCGCLSLQDVPDSEPLSIFRQAFARGAPTALGRRAWTFRPGRTPPRAPEAAWAGAAGAAMAVGLGG